MLHRFNVWGRPLFRVGSDIVIVADIAYHLSAETMSATVRCH